MKKVISILLCAVMVLSLAACGQPVVPDPAPPVQDWEGATHITMFDTGITVDGQPISTEETSDVYAAHDIVYYEAGKDFTYGEGTQDDAHSAEEAAAHTVVHITKPGTYVLGGTHSAGQVAVDLGDEAENDPNAVVTLVLEGLHLTCTVAPAIIFYSVYECGDKDNPTRDVDTSAAGANVILGAGTDNHINGSYVARIYKPGTVELNEDGTEVEDAKKLHKYDAAFYSKMSMNISGEGDGSNNGTLNITAENEGLDSELHLTINGGTINIKSGNDGINTNEDGVSVTTINGGNLNIQVTGETGEGDGIDSNGWLVINAGRVTASACATSGDAGIDSDMGIHIGAGATVVATGHMRDRSEDAEQNYAVFQFGGTQLGAEKVSLKNADDAEIMEAVPGNDYSILIFSSPDLTTGDYTLWSGETQLGHSGVQTGGMGGFAGGGGRPGGMKPGGAQMPEDFDPENLPEGMELPVWNGENKQRPELPVGVDPENMPMIPADRPEGMERPQGGMDAGRGHGGMNGGGTNATEKIFTVQSIENYFSGVGELSE